MVYLTVVAHFIYYPTQRQRKTLKIISGGFRFYCLLFGFFFNHLMLLSKANYSSILALVKGEEGIFRVGAKGTLTPNRKHFLEKPTPSRHTPTNLKKGEVKRKIAKFYLHIFSILGIFISLFIYNVNTQLF